MNWYKTLLIILFLLAPLFSFGQAKDCHKFRTGKFKTTDSEIGVNYITRNDSIQIEYVPNLKAKVALNVKWINQCTLQLTFNRVIENPDSLAIGKLLVLTEIIETKENSYIAETTVEGYDYMVKHEFLRIK
ncbi:hypothetical protein BXY85_3477 [Roseivirga pacifica]|uniref:Uncharacterized protein n=1 Tax=Roseivirga pacifica TaxID=1267423 RepID=A0A1I0QJU4_9BACT|nr:hypothetical protein [Roseivirga pacifica]RKQ42860.1 hypothetical protein BXY85_3477 [Roseivirga pacifica]SEW27299.1 hypothetical protein SAMN05216290_2398 [Roseivirga pacifica]